jgi:PilZ domain
MDATSMAEPQREQRTTRRFALRLPLTVKFPEGDAKEAQTRDVSARGISFYIDSAVTEGSPIEFTLTLPPEITLTESIRVHCTGKVVRVEPQTPGRVGIAAMIERYEFLAENA